METQLENSCVLKECLSGRSVLSFDEESDTNSVVYNKNEVGESPRVMGESPRGKEKEEALPMSQDFVEDDNTRFGEKKEKKSVSMGERLKNVWTRLGDGEEKKKKENEEKKKKNEEKKKEGEEKKKKEGEEKVSKFSMRLPMGKAKKEGEVQGAKKEGEEKNGAEVERREGEEGSAEKEGEGQGVKKEGEAQGAKKEGEGQMAKKGKWEIDQRKGMQCQ